VAAVTSPGFFARLGLAITRPRWALAVAADRNHAGRSGSDLILLILMLLVATQLRGFVGAAWLGKAVDAQIGLRAFVTILTRTLTVDLAFLVLGAFVLFATAGSKRNLGRAFDLACVAAIPLLLVEIVATSIALACAGLGALACARLGARGADVLVPMEVGWVLAAISWGWAGALLALAWRPARQSAPSPEVPAELVRPARIAGYAIAAIAALGTVFQILWVSQHVDSMRPVTVGNRAPAFALPVIDGKGALGELRGIAPGKVTVIDFWATWCKPCIVALPKLERMQREKPDIEILTINLDDAPAARALFERGGFTMPLLMDDGDVSLRYNVTNIPHTVVIDRDGMVRKVFRGGTTHLEAAVEEIRK
jgi:thiol-disulfide isomerase/thioredoxin